MDGDRNKHFVNTNCSSETRETVGVQVPEHDGLHCSSDSSTSCLSDFPSYLASGPSLPQLTGLSKVTLSFHLSLRKLPPVLPSTLMHRTHSEHGTFSPTAGLRKELRGAWRSMWCRVRCGASSQPRAIIEPQSFHL